MSVLTQVARVPPSASSVVAAVERTRRRTLVSRRVPSNLNNTDATADGRLWWKESTIYQIWPASFCDSNGDGLGDLGGVTSKLDYLQSLGVDCIWLSPIYKSPLIDMGYDIQSYLEIDPRYGTMAEFDTMIAEIHKRNMRLVMDLVVNHTSDLHPWFLESKAFKVNNPKRDWYIWRKGKIAADGSRSPPNNWLSVFRGGSAWEYSEETDEYYLHLFVKEQPDLNWENPEVRKAVYSVMHFWLGEKKVDGFRMDVINLISKVDGLPDATITEPDNLYQPSFEMTSNGPRVHEFLQEMHREVLSHYNILTVGETPYTHDPAIILPYCRSNELQMCFVFDFHNIDGSRSHSGMSPSKWKLEDLKNVVGKWQTALHGNGWNALYLENHDQARSISRFASDAPEYRSISGKMLAILQASQSGTIYLFQGQELAQINVDDTWKLEDFKDVAALTYYRLFRERRQRETGEENPDMSEALKNMTKKARDNGRTPVQWDDSANAGFTTGVPWTRIHDDYKLWNAKNQVSDPTSVWSFWKALLVLRKQNLVLVYGSFKHVSFEHEHIFSFIRTWNGDRALVVINFSDSTHSFSLVSVEQYQDRDLLMGNYSESNEDTGSDSIVMRAYEARIYLL